MDFDMRCPQMQISYGDLYFSGHLESDSNRRYIQSALDKSNILGCPNSTIHSSEKFALIFHHQYP